jgi:hypothetical protein
MQKRTLVLLVLAVANAVPGNPHCTCGLMGPENEIKKAQQLQVKYFEDKEKAKKRKK